MDIHSGWRNDSQHWTKRLSIAKRFFDGGAMGISLVLTHFTNIAPAAFIVGVNILFVMFGYQQISPLFAIKSAIAICFLAFAIHFMHLPVFTEDKLLISIFGGVLLGASIDLSMRGGMIKKRPLH